MNFEINYILKAEDLAVGDVNSLIGIDQRYFPTPWTYSAWDELFTNVPRLLSVFRLEKEIIGFALFNLSSVDSFGHLLKIIVLPEYRNQGKGEMLLGSSLTFLRENQEIKCFFLEVEATNQSAINAYERCGFKMVHRKKDFYGNGRDAFVMTI